MAAFPEPVPLDPTPTGAGFVQPWTHGRLLQEMAWEACVDEIAVVLGADRRGTALVVEGMPVALAARRARQVAATRWPWNPWRQAAGLARLRGGAPQAGGHTARALEEILDLAIVARTRFQGRRVWELAPRTTGALAA